MSNRTLATSVVVTVSLAQLVLGGCKTGRVYDNPPPPDYGKDYESADGDGVDEPAADGGEVADDGAADDAVAADDGAAPDDGPAPAEEGPTTSILKRDDGTCVEIVQVDCPPDVMCNPPPPQPVPCPEEPPAGA